MLSDAQLKNLQRRAQALVFRFRLRGVEAPDLLHDVLVSLYSRRETVREPYPYAWAALTLRAFRFLKHRRHTFVPIDPEMFSFDPDPDRQILARQLLSLRALPRSARRVLRLKACGYSADQIAQALNLAPSSVSGLFSRARKVCRLGVTAPLRRRSGSTFHLRSSAEKPASGSGIPLRSLTQRDA